MDRQSLRRRMQLALQPQPPADYDWEEKAYSNANMRWKTFVEISKADEEASGEFKVDDFTGGSRTSDTAISAHKSYKAFVALVAEVCMDSGEKYQAKTMYNIMTNGNKDKKQRVETAAGHFNVRATLFKRELDKIHLLAQELKRGKTDSNGGGAGGDTKQAFLSYLSGKGFTFHRPEVVGWPAHIDPPFGKAKTGDSSANVSATAASSSCSSDSYSTVKVTTAMTNGSGNSSDKNKEKEDVAWLLGLCSSHLVLGTVGAEGVFSTATALATELCSVCREHSDNPDMLQGRLFEVCGDSGFDLMLEVMGSVDRVGTISSAALEAGAGTGTGTGTATDALADVDGIPAELLAQIEAEDYAASLEGGGGAYRSSMPDIEGMSANQKRKWEKKREKEQRELQALQEAQMASAMGLTPADGDQQQQQQQQQQGKVDWLAAVGFSQEYLEQERALGLEKFKQPGSGDARWVEELKDKYGIHGLGTDFSREKKGLPAGSERKNGPGYEEVTIPAPKKRIVRADTDLVAISSLQPAWTRQAFQGMKRLNTIQSEVYNTAFNSSENMLICAPTGAGKTNIAMLSFLQLLKQHFPSNAPLSGGEDDDIDKDDEDDDEDDWYDDSEVDYTAIKAVYIAPMKALAQEVVAKFGARVKDLGITVRECTGDMQLTRNEIMDSQMLVVTPEKYDVITRKGGDGTLITMVSLVIIDEVHLLADERGAVIETIVARTQRYVESSQRPVRIVGLSATLPNYRDVARFLGVRDRDPKAGTGGLFHFGPEYRPVPLDTTYIGVTEKNRVKAKEQMNIHAYRKMTAALEKGKQVMVFVHSRKETMNTAEFCKNKAAAEGTAHLLDCHEVEGYTSWSKEVGAVEKGGSGGGGGVGGRGGELAQLFPHGMGIHHAGLHRQDRGLTERMFEAGAIKVLFCTATLAWGVNLPGHTVIIKGTELYDPERGGFVDVGILDILQIFGRAGRPQYDTTGHAVLITQHKSLNNYLALVGHQAPIESHFIKSLPDHLNAEIVNGTISNMHEARQWLSYTFLFIRMRQNPLVYGINQEDLYDDPQLDKKRMKLVEEAADTLDLAMMTRYDARSGNLGTTDLGRIASHYYIRHGSISAFNTMLTAHLTPPEALHVICSSAEFDQLKVRPEELAELEALKKTVGMNKGAAAVKIAADETAGKVGVLLTSYCQHERVQSFTLQSDCNYIAQNSGRICRALFEICLRRGWSALARHYLELSKCIEKKMGLNNSPLRQFEALPHGVVTKVEERELTPDRIITMTSGEIGRIIREQKWGSKVLSLAHNLPYLAVQHRVQPITRSILRITLTIVPDFQWNNQYHGMAEGWHIWVEDNDNERIYHSETLSYGRKQYDAGEEVTLEFTIPVQDPPPPQYFVRAVSDKWVSVETCVSVSFQHLLLPDRMTAHTPLLDVHPVPVQALQNPRYEALYSSKGISHFNPIQSQVFHTLYHTDTNVLLGAPTGSGKTIVAELAILRLLTHTPNAITVYVAPLKALARERVSDWKTKLGKSKANGGLGLHVVELTGESTPDYSVLNKAQVLIVTPEKWDVVSRGWRGRQYVRRVGLMILDEVHLLGVERGAVLEVIVSRMRLMSQQKSLLPSGNSNNNSNDKKNAAASPQEVRLVGLSTALANARDLADWLGIGQVGVYNFQPSVRPVPMSIFIQGFPGKHYCPRMATMNKPCYASIIEHSPTKPTLIFVSSRRQTRLTALDIISYCAADEDPRRFNKMSEEETELVALGLRDSALRSTIAFGVGIHHAGLEASDRTTVERLFLEGSIQVLVATSTLAWGVNLPCHLVIVKGTEFFDGKTCRYQDFPITDVLQMMGRAGRPQFDDHAVAVVMTHEPKKHFYKKFLHSPFPVESSLHTQLHAHISAEVNTGSLNSLGDCVEWLSWTYFFRRLAYNPSYYGLEDHSPQGTRVYIISTLVRVLTDLEDCGALLMVTESDSDNNKSSNYKASTNSSPSEQQQEVMVMPFSTIVTGLSQAQQSRVIRDKEDAERALESRAAMLTTAALGGSSYDSSGQGQDFLLLPQAAGRIASEYYLHHSTTGLFRKKLLQLLAVSTSSSSQHPGRAAEAMSYMLLLVLCDSHEYSQLPVRHNEDLLNMQLAQSVPPLPALDNGGGGATMTVAAQAYESPHAKAFLLLVAHVYALPLPIQDYINDTKSVLEQFPRLVNSLMEVLVLLASPSPDNADTSRRESAWPAGAVSPSMLLRSLAALSAMVATASAFLPDSKRQPAATITAAMIDTTSTSGGAGAVVVCVDLLVEPPTGGKSNGNNNSNNKRGGGSLWVVVGHESRSSSTNPKSNPNHNDGGGEQQQGKEGETLLAVRKIDARDNNNSNRGGNNNNNSHRTVKVELPHPLPSAVAMGGGLFVEVMSDCRLVHAARARVVTRKEGA